MQVYEKPPTALEFLRGSVQPNRPAIIKGISTCIIHYIVLLSILLLGGFDHWPARTGWTNEYLRSKMGETTVTVAGTHKYI